MPTVADQVRIDMLAYLSLSEPQAKSNVDLMAQILTDVNQTFIYRSNSSVAQCYERLIRSTKNIMAEGLRATETSVGYQGNTGHLKILNYGDPTPPSWAGDWVGNTALLIKAADQTVDGYLIYAAVVSDTTFSLTVKNSVILPPVGAGAGIICGGPLLVVIDTTVFGKGDGGSALSCNNGGKIEATRCYLNGFEDSVSFGAWKQSRCYMRCADGIDRHCDNIQELVFDASEIINCNMDASGNPLNPNIGVTGSFTCKCTNAVITGNYFDGGAYPMRFDAGAGLGAAGATIQNNNWGPRYTVGPHNFPDITMVEVWSNNRDSNGNLIPQPS